MQDFEQETGKKYINLNLNFVKWEFNTPTYIPIPLIDCGENSKYPGFYCINYSKITEEMKSLTASGKDFTVNNYEIQIQECKEENNCATKSEIDDVMIKSALYINIATQ